MFEYYFFLAPHALKSHRKIEAISKSRQNIISSKRQSIDILERSNFNNLHNVVDAKLAVLIYTQLAH